MINIKPEGINRSDLIKSTLKDSNIPEDCLSYPKLDDITTDPKKHFQQFKRTLFHHPQSPIISPDTAEDAFQIPKVGEITNIGNLGISIGTKESPPPEIPNGINIRIPEDLDTDRTDEYPYENQYPNLHLNLKLMESKDSIDHMIISDFPEAIRDSNQIIDTNITSPDGIYMLSTLPAGSTTRTLLDHTNYTKKTKEVKLFVIPKEDGEIYFYKKGSAVNKEAAIAASLSSFRSNVTVINPRLQLKKDRPVNISNWEMLGTGKTLVSDYEFKTSGEIQLLTVVSSPGELKNPTSAELLALPKQRIYKWKEKEEELKKWVKPGTRRYQRLLEEYVHPRGTFEKPDKISYSTYDYKKNNQASQFYSTEEAIGGQDELTREGGVAVRINNRGRYGAETCLHLDIKSLPKNVEEFVLIAINTSNISGGKFYTRVDEQATALDFSMPGYENKNLINYNECAVLWRGKLHENSSIDVRHTPLPNTSSKIWYALIPVKKQAEDQRPIY